MQRSLVVSSNSIRMPAKPLPLESSLNINLAQCCEHENLAKNIGEFVFVLILECTLLGRGDARLSPSLQMGTNEFAYFLGKLEHAPLLGALNAMRRSVAFGYGRNSRREFFKVHDGDLGRYRGSAVGAIGQQSSQKLHVEPCRNLQSTTPVELLLDPCLQARCSRNSTIGSFDNGVRCASFRVSPRVVAGAACPSRFSSRARHRPLCQSGRWSGRTFEAYVPKHKRLFGYFVCPVLIGVRIVAGLDLKTQARAISVSSELDPEGKRPPHLLFAQDREGSIPTVLHTVVSTLHGQPGEDRSSRPHLDEARKENVR